METSSNSRICRICFEEDEGKENPLLSPCSCSGSMQFVHIKCLQQWRSRTENRKYGPFVTTYTWKAFHCELCKTKLQDTYQVDGQNYQIFNVQKPDKNYMIIETQQINMNENDSEKNR